MSTAAMEEAQSELYFLALHCLANGPCKRAADLLENEAIVHGLLPQRTDYRGNSRSSSYAQLAAEYAHLPPSTLLDVLAKVKKSNQERDIPGAAGVSSILAAGKLGCLAPDQQSAPCPAPWLQRPHRTRSIPHRLWLRETGVRMPEAAPIDYSARCIKYQRTCRGHHNAVYCITFDKSGQRVITGSDDNLVKIWSVRTGTLLRTCRGHEAAITLFSVSSDNRLVASASNDTTIRSGRQVEARIQIVYWGIEGAEGKGVRHCACLISARGAVQRDGRTQR